MSHEYPTTTTETETPFKMWNNLLLGINSYCSSMHSKAGIGSYFAGTGHELLDLVIAHWEEQTPGYRDGVISIPVPSSRFYSAVRILEEGDKLRGTFQARQPGESPRKLLRATGERSPSKSTSLILYRGDVLKADRNNTLPGGKNSWEIIMINASPLTKPMPMHPSTLMANHFGDDGGTPTNMTDTEFVLKLKESYCVWRDKALMGRN